MEVYGTENSYRSTWSPRTRLGLRRRGVLKSQIRMTDVVAFEIRLTLICAPDGHCSCASSSLQRRDRSRSDQNHGSHGHRVSVEWSPEPRRRIA